jgi:hypothetical protein
MGQNDTSVGDWPDRRNVEVRKVEPRGGVPTPLFFVSVAFKGVSFAVSLLFASLAGSFISVAAKGLMGAWCWRESTPLGWGDLKGPGTSFWCWQAGRLEGCEEQNETEARRG